MGLAGLWQLVAKALSDQSGAAARRGSLYTILAWGPFPKVQIYFAMNFARRRRPPPSPPPPPPQRLLCRQRPTLFVEDPAKQVLQPSEQWERWGIGGFNTVIAGDGERAHRLYYECVEAPHMPVHLCLAESVDGLTWVKPALSVTGSNGNNSVSAAAGCTPFVEPKTHEVPESQRWKMVCSNSEGAFKAGDTSFTHHRHTMPCTHHITTQAQPACPKHLPAVTALCTQFDANVGCLGHPDGVPPPVAFGRADGADLGLARWLALAAAPTYESLDPRRWNPTDCCLG